eukprot:scaffold130390_cov31-Tisochrysis_lutea.AAC.2
MVRAARMIVTGDQTSVGFKNFDPRAPKFVFGQLLPRMPVRVARIVLFNPPWVFGKARASSGPLADGPPQHQPPLLPSSGP